MFQRENKRLVFVSCNASLFISVYIKRAEKVLFYYLPVSSGEMCQNFMKNVSAGLNTKIHFPFFVEICKVKSQKFIIYHINYIFIGFHYDLI